MRSFSPGTEWLYLKLYGGISALDDLLLKSVRLLAETSLSSGLIDRWFFIRYADPETHLRLRFHGRPDNLIKILLPAICESLDPLMASGALWRVQYDTYDREIERYGGVEATLAAEEIFFADSEAVLDVLAGFEGEDGLDLRWKHALFGTDCLLADCGFGLEEKKSLVERLRDSYGSRLKAGAMTWRQSGVRFRRERSVLQAMLEPTARFADEFSIAREAMARRSQRIAPAVSTLKSLARCGALQMELRDLAGSFVHMHVNRMMRDSANQHEVVLYDFLARLYDGQLARQRMAYSTGA